MTKHIHTLLDNFIKYYNAGWLMLCLCVFAAGCDTGVSTARNNFIVKNDIHHIGQPAQLGKNGCPDKAVLASTHDSEMFIAMHRDNGYSKPKPYELWNKQYPHTVTFIPLAEDGAFTLIINQIKLGVMPLTMAAYFPLVRIIQLDGNRYSLRAEQTGWVFFFSSQLDPSHSSELSYLKQNARMFSKTAGIDPFLSEVKIKNETLCFKIGLDWNISFESLKTDGNPETEQMKEGAQDMYTSVKSITGTRGNYRAVFDEVKDRYSGYFFLTDK